MVLMTSYSQVAVGDCPALPHSPPSFQELEHWPSGLGPAAEPGLGWIRRDTSLSDPERILNLVPCASLASLLALPAGASRGHRPKTVRGKAGIGTEENHQDKVQRRKNIPADTEPTATGPWVCVVNKREDRLLEGLP